VLESHAGGRPTRVGTPARLARPGSRAVQDCRFFKSLLGPTRTSDNFPMGTRTFVPVEEYLPTDYEPDCDYVDGN
jgi:hypothetical protein